MNTEALAAGLAKYRTDWGWNEVDIEYLVDNIADNHPDEYALMIAHYVWTMGAWLKHPKCPNNPKKGNDADYENGCAPCQAYLLAVAESILLSIRVADALAQTATDGTEGKWYYRSRLDVIGKILRGDDIEPEIAPPVPCLCDAGLLHTEAENRARHPFIVNTDCSIHGSQSQVVDPVDGEL